MAIASIVSTTEGAIKIRIRVIFFTEQKIDFVEKRAKRHNLYIPQIAWGGLSWPEIYVKGEKEDIESFFNDLKKEFILPPCYL